MAGWADLQAGSPAGAMRAPHLLRWQNAFLKSWPLNFAALITKEKNVKTQTFGPGPWSQGSRPKSRALGGVGNKVTLPPTHPLASHACPLLAGVPPPRWQLHSVPPVPGQQQVGPSGPGQQLVLAGGRGG